MDARDNSYEFLANGGRIGDRICRLDWSRHPLGPIETWDSALRTTLAVVLSSSLPTFLVWGAGLTMFFNDACAPLMGDKVLSLGSPYPAVWHDTWASLRPYIRRVLDGESFVFENCAATLERHGQSEQAWFTFTYAPVRDSAGTIGGLLCTCAEVTGALPGERRVPVTGHHHGIPATAPTTMPPAAGALPGPPDDP